MINKEKLLTKEFRKNVILADLGDPEAKVKVQTIGKMISANEIPDKCKPIIVIHPTGNAEMFICRDKAQKECKIGCATLKKCIDLGVPDRLGRCYDYMIL